MRALMILNPAAGDGQSVKLAREAAERPGRGRIDVVETACAEDCRAFTDRALDQGYDTLIVGGGDGTVHDVVNALGGRFDRLRLAVMPVGTANDLSKTLSLPREPEAVLDLIEAGTTRRIDLIRVKSDGGGANYLINAASGGFSEAVNARLDDEQKERWGALAYLRVALDALPEATMHHAAIIIDDERFDVHTCAVIVANGRYTGGVRIAPGAQIDDRRMDVGAVLAETISDRARLLAKAVAGRHMDDEHLLFRHAKRMRIEADPPMLFNGDGEELGRTPMTFELMPAAVEVVAPAEAVGSAPRITE